MNVRIFVAERIHTFSPRVAGNALAVAHGRILSLGDVASLGQRYRDAEVIDLGRTTITPGLTDAHIHVTEWALARQHVDLAEASSIEECLRIVARTPAGAGWLQGRGWNPHRWGGAYPGRAELDSVAPDRPVALQSHDMHALWVNSEALRQAGIDRNTPDPEGGRIVRDAQGEPTGMLLENAAQLAVSRIPLPQTEDVIEAVFAAQHELHSFGITGIHSFPGVHLPEPDPLPVLTQLQAAGSLRLRVLQHISADKLEEAIRIGLRSGFGGDWIRMGGMKLFLDGALGSRTAWMREPYENSSDCGVQVLSRKEFSEFVQRAAENGIASVVHAIGDAAVTMAFEVLGAAPRVQAMPHRVEHVQCLPAESGAALHAGVICSVQPCHLMTDWAAADRHWGARAARTYAFRTMLDSGAILACGSDAPVEPADPRLGLYAAVARRDAKHQPEPGWYPEQRITLLDVFTGYTRGAAAAAGTEQQQGVLQPGAFADFVAWRTDPLACNPMDLLDLSVAATVVGGEVVYQA